MVHAGGADTVFHLHFDVFLRRISAAAEERKYFLGFPASAGYAPRPSIHFFIVVHTPALSQPPSFFLFSLLAGVLPAKHLLS